LAIPVQPNKVKLAIASIQHHQYNQSFYSMQQKAPMPRQ